MTIVTIWTGNAARNFNYLVGCEVTGDALAVDPLDHGRCMAEARRRGWTISQIVNTHEHGDHTGGNAALIAVTGATLLAHTEAPIPGVDRRVGHGDTISVGRSVTLQVLDTPGHTRAHVCLLRPGATPALLAGDTLFNAGVGNCHNGGDPELLYESFLTILSVLPPSTALYPGHDYLARNLAFTLAREPSNRSARDLLDLVGTVDPPREFVSNLGLEREINVFFRTAQPEVVAGVRRDVPDLPEIPSERAVFLALRMLRNRW